MYDIIDKLAGKLLSFIGIIIFLVISLKLIIELIKAFNKTIHIILDYINKNNHINNLKEGILTLEDLQDLSSSEFQYWCLSFLDKKGYSDIQIIYNQIDKSKNITCYNGTIKIYVECKKYIYSKYAVNKVDLEICRNFIGILEGNKLLDGIIITSGIITNKAIDYINSLPKDFNIKLYDGKDLLKIHENYRNMLIKSMSIY